MFTCALRAMDSDREADEKYISVFPDEYSWALTSALDVLNNRFGCELALSDFKYAISMGVRDQRYLRAFIILQSNYRSVPYPAAKYLSIRFDTYGNHCLVCLMDGTREKLCREHFKGTDTDVQSKFAAVIEGFFPLNTDVQMMPVEHATEVSETAVVTRKRKPSETVRVDIRTIVDREVSSCWAKVKAHITRLDGINEGLGVLATDVVVVDVIKAVIDASAANPFELKAAPGSDMRSCMSDILRRCDGLSLS